MHLLMYVNAAVLVFMYTAVTISVLLLHSPSVHVERVGAHCKWVAGEGEYGDAAVAYEAAGDLDSVVRLSLEQLKSPHRAAAIVRKAGSREAAQRLAHYCLAARDYQVSGIVHCVGYTCDMPHHSRRHLLNICR